MLSKSSWMMVGAVLFLLLLWIIFMQTPATPPQQEVTEIYFADNISVVHQRLIDTFNCEFEGQIKIVPINLPFTKFSTNERKELLARTLRSKSNRVDILAVDVIWVPRFAKWCQPLDVYFSRFDRDEIIPQALESCQFEGQLFAIPFYIDVGMMYYRSDLLREFPDADAIEKRIKESITWEELIALDRRYQSRGRPFYLFPADNYEGLVCSFIEGAANQDYQFIQGDHIRLNAPETSQTLQLLVDLIYRYRMTPPIVTKYDEFQCYLDFLKNDGLFLRGWPGFLKHYRHVVPDTSKFKVIKKAPLPHFKNGSPSYVFGGWNLMISKNSEHTKEAIAFIQFLHREANQKLLFQEGGYLPIIKSVYQDSLFARQEPDLIFYSNLIKNGVHRPYLVDYTKISDIIAYYLNLALKREISVAEALEQATQLVNSNQLMIK